MKTDKKEEDLINVIFKTLTYPHTSDSSLIKHTRDGSLMKPTRDGLSGFSHNYTIKKFVPNVRDEMGMQYPIFYLSSMKGFLILSISHRENPAITIKKFQTLQELILYIADNGYANFDFIRIK